MEQTKDKVDVRVGQVWETCTGRTVTVIGISGMFADLDNGTGFGESAFIGVMNGESGLKTWKLIKDI